MLLNGNLPKSPSTPTHKQCGLWPYYSRKHTKNAIVSKMSNHHATRLQSSNTPNLTEFQKKSNFLITCVVTSFASVLVVAVCGSSGRGFDNQSTKNNNNNRHSTVMSLVSSILFVPFFLSLFSLFFLCFFNFHQYNASLVQFL